jgi:hypothetical protein
MRKNMQEQTYTMNMLTDPTFKYNPQSHMTQRPISTSSMEGVGLEGAR